MQRIETALLMAAAGIAVVLFSFVSVLIHCLYALIAQSCGEPVTSPIAQRCITASSASERNCRRHITMTTASVASMNSHGLMNQPR